MTLAPARPGQVIPHGRTVPIPVEEIARRTRIVREAMEGEAAAKTDAERAYWIRARRRELAAVDSAAFCEFTLTTERGNQPITNDPVHVEWHQILAYWRRAVIWAAIEMGKTQQLTIGYTLWRLGRSQGEDRVIIVSDPQKKAMKIGRALQRHIERNAALHEVFPLLRRSRRREDPWGASAFTVERESFSKDPSVQCTGTQGSVSGSRADHVTFDDAVTRRNSRKKERRTDLSEWSLNECYSRLGDGGQALNLNAAYHPHDLTNERAKIPGTFAKRFPVVDETGRIRTRNWGPEELAQKIRDLGGDKGIEKRRQLDVEDVGDEETRFDDEWIAGCISDEYALTWSLSPDERAALVAQGAVLVIGGDYAAAKKKRLGAKTSFFVLAVYPDGTHQVLWIEAGRWKSPDIRDRMIDLHERFGAVLFCEDNGVQSWIIENVEEISDTPMVPHTTGANKHDPTFGVESMGVQMSQGKWIVPRHPASDTELVVVHPKFGMLPATIAEWIDDLKEFSPVTHTGDVLMSSWIAKEGARTLRARRGGSVEVLGGDVPAPAPKRSAIEVELSGR